MPLGIGKYSYIIYNIAALAQGNADVDVGVAACVCRCMDWEAALDLVRARPAPTAGIGAEVLYARHRRVLPPSPPFALISFFVLLLLKNRDNSDQIIQSLGRLLHRLLHRTFTDPFRRHPRKRPQEIALEAKMICFSLEKYRFGAQRGVLHYVLKR